MTGDVGTVVDVAGADVSVGVADDAGVSVGLGDKVAVALDVMVGPGKAVEEGKFVAAGVGSGASEPHAVKTTIKQSVITILND